MHKKHRILIDLLRLRDTKTGLGQVMWHYARTLSQTKVPDMIFTFLVPPSFVGAFGDTVLYRTLSLWDRYTSAFNGTYDLWHATHQDVAAWPRWSASKLVLTIHDLNFLETKSPAKIRRRLKSLQAKIERANRLIAISATTKTDVEAALRVGKVPFDTIYNGVEVPAFPEAQRPKTIPSGPFFLAMGVFKPNKNFESLLRMMVLDPSKTLVIAGQTHTEYGQKLLALKTEMGLKNVICPGPVDDFERYWLMANCEAFLFPSTKEGMGLPLVEALSFGKPVFCSRLSCMPEFGREHAHYWENFEPENMLKIIHTGLENFSAPQAKAEQAYAATFSWSTFVETHLRIFRETLETKL